MSDINRTVAEEVVKLLKGGQLIAADEKNIETKIAGGTIKENDWKLLFEQQIRNIENKTDEAK